MIFCGLSVIQPFYQENGKPVWLHNSKRTRYLFYSSLGVWGIGSDYRTTGKGVIRSKERNLADIPKVGWMYKEKYAWTVDPELKVIGW